MIRIKEIREAKAFNEYRDYLIGKYHKTYFNTIDLILNVYPTDCGIEYTVRDIKTNELRKHNTFINKKGVYNA